MQSNESIQSMSSNLRGDADLGEDEVKRCVVGGPEDRQEVAQREQGHEGGGGGGGGVRAGRNERGDEVSSDASQTGLVRDDGRGGTREMGQFVGVGRGIGAEGVGAVECLGDVEMTGKGMREALVSGGTDGVMQFVTLRLGSNTTSSTGFLTADGWHALVNSERDSTIGQVMCSISWDFQTL